MADTAPAAAAPSAPPATSPAAPEAGAPTPPAAATEPKKPVTPQDAIAQIEGTESFEALEAELDKANAPKSEEPEPAAAAPATAPTPAPAAPAAPTDGSKPPAEPAAAAPAGPGSVTDDENATIDDPATGEKLTKNFRFHTDDPARSRYLKLLRQEPGANPIELALRAGYTLPGSASTATPAATAAPAATTAQAIDETLKPMRDEIEALQAQKKAHREAFEFGEADAIADQILDKRLALERRQSELESQAAYETEFSTGYESARAEAGAKYPDTLVKGTQQFEEVAREVAYLEAHEPGFFDDPNYPVELIKRLETRRPDLFKSATPGPGAASAAAAPAPAAPPAVTPPPNAQPSQPARPVGQVAPGTATVTQPLTRQATEEAIENMDDPEELAKLADAVGTKVGPKSRR